MSYTEKVDGAAPVDLLSEARFDQLLDSQVTGERAECRCRNCRPDLDHSKVTWRDNITCGVPGDPDATWCAKTACANLGINRWIKSWRQFANPEGLGKSQGAVDKNGDVWVAPESPDPLKTMLHELGHWRLGHCTLLGKPIANTDLIVTLSETEAEATAMLACDSLGDQEGVKLARAYIENYIGKRKIPDALRPRIKKAAREILRAGVRRISSKAA
jgi:hypothetical protein